MAGHADAGAMEGDTMAAGTIMRIDTLIPGVRSRAGDDPPGHRSAFSFVQIAAQTTRRTAGSARVADSPLQRAPKFLALPAESSPLNKPVPVL